VRPASIKGQNGAKKDAKAPGASAAPKRPRRKLRLREKLLIFAVILIALVMALVFLLIMPTYTQLVVVEQEYSDLASQRQTTDTTIATIPGNQERIGREQLRYNDFLQKYQAPMLPEDLDRMVTVLLEDCGFRVSSLTLSPLATETVDSRQILQPSWQVPTAADPLAQQATSPLGGTLAGSSQDAATIAGLEPSTEGSADQSPEYAAQASTYSADSAAASASSATVSSGSGASVMLYNVNASVQGSNDNFYILLDRKASSPWISIGDYTLVLSAPATSSSATTTTTTTTTPSSNGDTGRSDLTTFSLQLKIYVHPLATLKTP
jgi:cell division protein FtsL